MTAPPDDTTTDTSAIIAALRTERDAALAREAALAEALAQRNSEYGERIEQQSATIDVLKVMSASPGDPQPVFDLIVRRAQELCNSKAAGIFEYDGELVHIRSHYGDRDIAGLATYFAAYPMMPIRGLIPCRAILDKQVVHIRDTSAELELLPIVRDLEIRSVLAIPLRRDGAAIGAFVINSIETGGFSDSQAALSETFAEQAVIAITSAETYRALQERTEALATRNSEYGERIEQQSATIDVLQVMSSSPGDAQPVFELIVERARAFCGADECTVALLDGDMLHLKALVGMSEASARNYAAQFPRPVNTASMFGRAILAREAVQTPDVSADPEHFSRTRVGGPEFRAIVAVPMLRAGTPIGAIGLGRKIPGVYSATQMELLRTFADQAVIAITSAETYRALQIRTADLQESLEYQTASSDVLKVISRSTFDLQPVLETLVETAARLCDADQAVIARPEGDLWRLRANFGFPPEFEAYQRDRGLYSLDPHAPNVSARAVRERRPVHIHDVAEIPGYPEIFIRLAKQRTSLGVPLLREGEAIGYIVLARQRVEPFTERQIDLVSTFADQAVIAIENTRLITEQREALEQQTATAEVLQVINASPGNLAPVFDAMLEKATRLCQAEMGTLWTYDGEYMQPAAMRGVPPAYADFLKRGPRRPNLTQSRVLRGELVTQAIDITESEAYRSGDPLARAGADLGGIRTVLVVPLRKDETALGTIGIYRQEVRSFTDKQIALLQNFAGQAVIAMENARLITETREALEQQTATAEVLQVINASPGNLGPVFEAMLDKAMHLCEANFGGLLIFDGDRMRPTMFRGVPSAYSDYVMNNVISSAPETNVGRIARGANVVHIPDLMAEAAYQNGQPDRRASVELAGARTALCVALRKDDTLLGMIAFYRQEVRPFSERQIALLQSFAAQAVIAMENARLLTEQREALEQQTATAEVLQVINTSPGDLAPVFDAMLEKALRLCDAAFGNLWTYDGEVGRLAAICGASPEYRAELMRAGPQKPEPGASLIRLVEGEPLVHIADITAEGAHRSGVAVRRMLADRAGARTVLWVPMRKDGALLGFFTIYRTEVRPFTDKQIALLENFAAQAVIAMENARLINETREALEQQTATAEVLQVINSSPGDLAPVFDAMLEKAMCLCEAAFGSLYTYDGHRFRSAAQRGVPATYAAYRESHPPELVGQGGLQQAVSTRRAVQTADMMAERLYLDGNPNVRAMVDLGGIRTIAAVPLCKDETVLGVMSIYRQEVRPYSDRQIALLENFAAQAVIAMENARLLTEQQEALEQQTATAEVLQVINSSPGNLAPVFKAILEKAHSLCGATKGAFVTFDGEHFHVAATRGLSDAYTTILQNTHRRASAGYADGELSPREQLLKGADLIHLTGRALAVGPIGRAGIEIEKIRTVLFMPLRRNGTLLGYITAYREEEALFSDKQIALLHGFAVQAVIAMENARLIEEQREALQQQTATAEVLQVINASPGNLSPVFEAILHKAHSLCGAAVGALAVYDGDFFRAIATLGYPEQHANLMREPYPPNHYHRQLLHGDRIVHIPDVKANDFNRDDEVGRSLREGTDVRTGLAVPLRKDGSLLGYISAFRREVRLFSEKEIALLENFAAQAVIAMENARLMTEQREALEQQTATAEVLGVINASPGNLPPVFDAMLEKAMRLCEAAIGVLFIADGDVVRVAQSRNVPLDFGDYLEREPPRLDAGSLLSRAMREQTVLNVTDLRETAPFRDRVSLSVAAVELGGIRSICWAPLVHQTRSLGLFAIFRQEVRAFSSKQIALLENFAAQAVIAIENARLLNEQREALEQQTATAELLQTINSSPGDLAPVFDAMLDKALRLCGAAFGALRTFDGGTIHQVASRNLPPRYAEYWNKAVRLDPANTVFRAAVLDQRTVQIEDMAAEQSYRAGASIAVAGVELGGVRTLVHVPLIKDNITLGVLTVFRQEVRLFSDKELGLLQNFAAQAVIAMENARLLAELRQRTEELARRNSQYGERIEQQSATIDVLKAMSASPDDARPIFQAIVERARAICNADNANLALVDGDMLNVQATTIGSTATAMEAAERAHYMAQFPRPVDATSLFGRAILARDAVQTVDVRVDPQHFARDTAVRALVAVPLLRGGAPIGAIVLARNTPGEFSATQVELLRTFAEQAVIAISSAETFKELQRRTTDLTRSVSELEALEEVLRAVNSSLDLDTVLTTIVSRAVQLSQADEGTIYEYDASEQVFIPKSAFGMSAERVAALRERRIKLGETHLGRSAIQRAPVYVEDVQQDPSVPNAAAVLPGIHAVLAVPLLRNDTVIGGLVIRRRTEEGFAETIVTLMQTFSGQAVLAIENARLFQEAGRARTAAEAALVDLRRAQDRLVQSEKMASLGQLTAGIAHEIKNPLNFVNNFSDLSVDLLNELQEAVAPGKLAVADGLRAEIDDVTATLKGNLEKIAEHGRRADSIVKNMLLHSRTGPSEHRAIDVNTTVEEALNLAYHGARAETPGFDITMEKDLDPKAGSIDAFPQEFLRVMLNLISNGFYASRKRANAIEDKNFEPTLHVTTHNLGNQVEIRVRDNGTGIGDEVRDKIFEPFFTTKPAGEGTGLGLSLSYDIIVKQHGGQLTVDSRPNDFTEFKITLPRSAAANEGSRA